MPRDPDIESLRDLFDSGKVWTGVGEIIKLELTTDRSVWRAKVKVFPDGHEIIARMTWGQVGPMAGIFGPASVGDYVAFILADADEDNAYVISRLSSKADKIPAPAADGHTVIKSLAGKKIMLGAAGDQESAEPFVLGLVLQQLLVDILDELKAQADALASHEHLGNLGAPTPLIDPSPFTSASSEFSSLKSSPVEDDTIISDVIYGEKG